VADREPSTRTRVTGDRPPPPPPPSLKSVVPILFVRDVETSAAWYGRLGFGIDFLHGSPPFYGAISRDDVCLHLRHVREPNFAELAAREASLILATIEVTGVEALFEEIRHRDVDIAQHLVRQPWGGFDFQVRDVDGNTISFVQYLGA
jgi:Glyoxalase/Bleomycin resistance protein/Dioxygenase superfamily